MFDTVIRGKLTLSLSRGAIRDKKSGASWYVLQSRNRGSVSFFKKKGEFCYTVRRAQPGSAHLTSPQSVVLHSLHVIFKRVSNPKAPDDARFLTILYRVDPLHGPQEKAMAPPSAVSRPTTSATNAWVYLLWPPRDASLDSYCYSLFFFLFHFFFHSHLLGIFLFFSIFHSHLSPGINSSLSGGVQFSKKVSTASVTSNF